MLALAIESSTRIASIAIAEKTDGGPVRLLIQNRSSDPKSHSEFINPAIENALVSLGKSLQDIDLFAVGIGPGSFTGVRVAVNIARTFCLLMKKPVFTSDSLSTLQSCLSDRHLKGDCVTIINAYKNMIYFSAFKNGTALCASQAINAVDLEEKMRDLGLKSPILCLGDGFDAYKSFFSEKLQSILLRDSSLSDFPEAQNLARAALEQDLTQNLAKKSPTTLDWKSIIPLYLRASTAEENLQSK